jgi:hypothetical protein
MISLFVLSLNAKHGLELLFQESNLDSKVVGKFFNQKVVVKLAWIVGGRHEYATLWSVIQIGSALSVSVSEERQLAMWQGHGDSLHYSVDLLYLKVQVNSVICFNLVDCFPVRRDV